MRWKTLAALAGALCLLAGCEWMQPRVTSPVSGKDVTAAELLQEAEGRQADLERERQAKLDDAAAKLRKAKADAQLAIERIRSEQTISAAQAQQQVSEVVVKSQGAIDQADADAKSAQADFERSIATLESRVQASLDVISRQQQAVTGIAGMLKSVPVVGQAINSAGIDPITLAGLVFGGGGLTWAARAKIAHKTELAQVTKESTVKADAAYDQGAEAAKAAANEARQREHAAWDEAMRTAQAEFAARASAAANAQQGSVLQLLSLLVNPETLKTAVSVATRSPAPSPDPSPAPSNASAA